jgi:drug/metabolite transporter (DMT)-like permease
MGASQTIPILLNLLAAIVGASGQYLYKLGGTRLGQIPLWRNWQLFSGVALFCVVMGLFVAGFKLGGRLSVVYPMYATTFLWGTALAVLVDKEPWSWLQLLGVAIVVAGVALVAVAAPR